MWYIFLYSVFFLSREKEALDVLVNSSQLSLHIISQFRYVIHKTLGGIELEYFAKTYYIYNVLKKLAKL